MKIKGNSSGGKSYNLKEVTKNYKRIEMNLLNNKNRTNSFTIIFFHGRNHASLKYNYTFEDGNVRKNYFLNKLGDIANLFLYDRPEEMLRFNYEEGKSNCNVDYPNYTLESHVKNLHQFLLHEKVKPPFVLVSHSIGALYALKFAQKYPEETIHVFLIDPIQYTEKVAKELSFPPLSQSEIKNYLEIINTPKSSKKSVEKSLQALDSNTYSIPYFKPKLECHLTTFFNLDTKSTVHDKLTLRYLEELKKYNPSMNNYFFYDRDHYLNETNPQGIVTKIRKDLESSK